MDGTKRLTLLRIRAQGKYSEHMFCNCNIKFESKLTTGQTAFTDKAQGARLQHYYNTCKTSNGGKHKVVS